MKTFKSADLHKFAPIEFELDGEMYSYQPGKRSDVLLALIVPGGGKGATKELDRTGQLLNWFANGLNSEHNEKHDRNVEDCQACKIEKKLRDPNDPLDVETVIEVATWLIGESTGSRPTT